MPVAPPRFKSLSLTAQKAHTPYRGSRVLVVLLVVAAFGPYLMGSIRTEQLAVYALAPLLLFTFVRLRSWSAGILSAWLISMLVVSIGHIFGYQGVTPAGPGSALAGYDGLLLPLIVMTLIWTLVPLSGAESVLRAAAKWTVGLSALNAVLAIISLVMPSMVSLLVPFWSGGSSGESVADRAMMMGRFSGIFNQPAEAGLVYSVGAVFAVWAYAKRPSLMYLLMGVITVGGMLSVSKIFLLVGLPVAIVLVLATQKLSGWVGVFLAGSLLAVLLGTASFFQDWTGLNYLVRLFEVPEHQTATQFYTAGRWSENSALLQLADFILGASPLIGMGVAGLTVPYDSLWTESLVMGGVFTSVAMIGVFVAFIWSFRKIADRSLRFTAYAFWVVLVGASFGIPSLTVNRAATLVWVIAAILVAVAAHTTSRIDKKVEVGLRK